MFDFVNYTYSGLLSIIAALIGLACPLIIGRIENIDKRYKCTLLTERFKNEFSFRLFEWLMVLNIIVAVLFPFLIDRLAYARVWIAIQSGCVFVLLVSLIVLFTDMLAYTTPESICERIRGDYRNARRSNDKEKEELYFSQLIDIAPRLLISARYDVTQQVYDELYGYVKGFYENNPDNDTFDDYFLAGITRINEFLCQKEHRLISLNNSNTILTLLIPSNHSIPDKHYQFLWKNLVLQEHYGQDRWIMFYWEIASQRHKTNVFNVTYSRDYDEEKNAQFEEKKKENWRFLEFHIGLVAMLLQKQKYDLVKRMLRFTNSQPQEYPLVPSTIAEVLDAFNSIHKTSDEPGMFLYYEKRFRMPDMHGINDDEILGALYSYLALLFYRVYTLPWYLGEEFALRNGINVHQTNLQELRMWKDSLRILEFWLKKLDDRPEWLEIIGYDRSMTDKRYKKTKGATFATPKQILNDAAKLIDKANEKLRRSQPFSKTKIDALNEGIVTAIKDAMESYKLFIAQPSSGGDIPLNCAASHVFPNTAFVYQPDVSYVDIDETMAQLSYRQFMISVCQLFRLRVLGETYKIASENLLKALDKLGISEDFVILSFGNNLDYWFQKDENGIVRYKGVEIYSIPNYSPLIESAYYIMRREDLPSVKFIEPHKDMIEKYKLEPQDATYQVWTSLLRVKDHPDLKPNPREETGENMDEISRLTIGWRPVVNMKPLIEAIIIKVWYRFRDEGNPDDLDKINPIVKDESIGR